MSRGWAVIYHRPAGNKEVSAMARGVPRIISRWFRDDRVIYSFISLLAGLILSSAISAALNRGTFLLICAVIVLSFFSIGYLKVTTDQVKAYLGSHPYVLSTGQTPEQIEAGYKKMTDIVRKANSRIIVLGADITGWENRHLLSERSGFLAAIESVIRAKVEADVTFTYMRIAQSPSARTLQDEDRVSRKHMDESTFDHLEKVVEVIGDSTLVNLKLYVREPIEGCPSIVVVDEEYVSLAIVGDRDRPGNKYAKSVLGMIHIEDHTKDLPPQYAHIVEGLVAYEKARFLEVSQESVSE
jgi:hypothetical protein